MSYTVKGDVAVITMENPPVNALGYALRAGIMDGLEKAEADPNVNSIVLIGNDRCFCGGADIREFNTPLVYALPGLNDILAMLDRIGKPVIAAVGGICMGGGLELALACHYRVALPGAQVALPEVKLGILPGAGGTQRLPRAIGLELALNMIVTGEPISSEKFKEGTLFDAMVKGDLLEGALAFAKEKRPIKRLRDVKVQHENVEGYLMFARNTVGAMAKNFPAPLKCVQAVGASATMAFDDGIRLERELIGNLMLTPESRALRHAFFAERAASKVPDVPESTPTRPIKNVAVIGAGTMGGGIAMNFLNAGLPVVILEAKQEALDRGINTIRNNYEASAKKGRLKPQDVVDRMALLKPTLSFDDVKDADLVIEAVFEEMGVKEGVFRKLDSVMKPGAILATNTSTLNVDTIASFTKRPEDVVGLHFFSPANVMKLLEVVRAKKTSKEVMATVMQLAKKIKKVAVVSGVCDGFIGNRMVNRYSNEAMKLVTEGASPQQVDRALEKFGFAMGLFRMGDLAGNDIGWSIRKRHYAENPKAPRNLIADKLCELGRFGQKTGKGWYRYQQGSHEALPDPEVDTIIAECRKELGITPRKIGDDEIVERCVYALVNEGARILEEGIAARSSDIDMVYLTGYGFPMHRGGPMHYADSVGLLNVVKAMKRFAANGQSGDAFWQPAPLLLKLASENKTLTEGVK